MWPLYSLIFFSKMWMRLLDWNKWSFFSLSMWLEFIWRFHANRSNLCSMLLFFLDHLVHLVLYFIAFYTHVPHICLITWITLIFLVECSVLIISLCPFVTKEGEDIVMHKWLTEKVDGGENTLLLWGRDVLI